MATSSNRIIGVSARRVEFFLPGAPIPAPRPRFRVINAHGKQFVSTYYDKKYKTFLEAAPKVIRSALNTETAHVPFTQPVSLIVTFWIDRPKSTKRDTPRFDIDNYLKSIMDAMTHAAVWTDDDLVASVVAAKRFVAPNMPASTYVAVEDFYDHAD